MIPHIPQQRKNKSNDSTPFNDLNDYIEANHEQEKGQGRELKPKETKEKLSSKFDDLLNYATQSKDKETKVEKCLAIRTHNLTDLKSASAEMNAVAAKNPRCKDPAYHIILSWPEHEKPETDAIFDAAEHALKALGLAEHQYVLAIHGNTDNIHCHISVNRVHPTTYKSRNIEWAIKTLHMAARESEIKHNWTNDNGIYIVEQDGHGKKRIVANPDYINTITRPHAHGEDHDQPDEIQPAWHDATSLDSWLKGDVNKALKHAIKTLDGWPALHAWLDQYGITIRDAGGGGLRLRVTQTQTGETIEIAASKGIRNINRPELEKRWGKFVDSTPIPCKVPDLSDLSIDQLNEGINDVITRDKINGEPPRHIIERNAEQERRRGRGLGTGDDILRDQQLAEESQAQGSGGLHELSPGRLDGTRQDTDMLLSDTVQNGMGDPRAGEDQNVRRTGTSKDSSTRESRQSGRGLNRDDSKRQERKEQRAKQRVDLKNRFAQYNRFVRDSDTDHFVKLKQLSQERRQKLKVVNDQAKASIALIPKNATPESKLLARVEINAIQLEQKLKIEALHQDKLKAIKATRSTPLSWRVWLHEQSNLGDQAALSALRGIVYQAGRDAKKKEEQVSTETPFETEEQKFKKLMRRLLEEEKREMAIRSANMITMRPYEADALLQNYIGIQWRVTGNGNVEFSSKQGDHLFTDRGNRVTFDREIVTDDSIRLALVHAQQKFGREITLTGDDPRFKARMARLADDMGLTVLNPELQDEIASHRAARTLDEEKSIIATSDEMANEIEQQANNQEYAEPSDKLTPDEMEQTHMPVNASMAVPMQADSIQPTKTTQEQLRELVLSIDPTATFSEADTSNTSTTYIGRIAAEVTNPEPGFAQHSGKGIYVIHMGTSPENHNNKTIEVKYRQGETMIQIKDQSKGRVD